MAMRALETSEDIQSFMAEPLQPRRHETVLRGEEAEEVWSKAGCHGEIERDGRVYRITGLTREQLEQIHQLYYCHSLDVHDLKEERWKHAHIRAGCPGKVVMPNGRQRIVGLSKRDLEQLKRHLECLAG